MVYTYPAIFLREENDYYSVTFPDIENCFTSGKGIDEATEMAKDALCLMLYDMETKGIKIPDPSIEVKLEAGEIMKIISCDTTYYREFFKNKEVGEK